MAWDSWGQTRFSPVLHAPLQVLSITFSTRKKVLQAGRTAFGLKLLFLYLNYSIGTFAEDFRSPGELWGLAHAKTQALKTFRGECDSMPDIPGAKYILLARLREDGSQERKEIIRNKGSGSEDIWIHNSEGFWKSGTDGQVIKMNYDDFDLVEAREAAQFDEPYTYSLVADRTIGNDDCQAIKREQIPALFQAMLEIAASKAPANAMRELELSGRTLADSMPSIQTAFIRKSDQIIKGYENRNSRGVLLQSRIFDAIFLDEPLRDSDFKINTVHLVAVDSENELRAAFVQKLKEEIVAKEKLTFLKKRRSSSYLLAAGVLIAAMLFYFFRRYQSS